MIRSDPELGPQKHMAEIWSKMTDNPTPIITETSNDALNHVKDCDAVLVTGSLHLVGTVMSIVKVPII